MRVLCVRTVCVARAAHAACLSWSPLHALVSAVGGIATAVCDVCGVCVCALCARARAACAVRVVLAPLKAQQAQLAGLSGTRLADFKRNLGVRRSMSDIASSAHRAVPK